MSVNKIPNFPRKSPMSKRKRTELKVKRAIEEKKVFTIIGGSQFDLLRLILKSRGWIENIENRNNNKKTKVDIESLMVQGQPSFFVWLPRNHHGITVSTVQSSWISRMSRQPAFDFTRKDGLKRCQDEIRWHYQKGISDLNSPRTFTMHDYLGRQEFEKEFKFTSATGFLAFFNFHHDFSSLFSERGTMSRDSIDCALQHVESVLKFQRHEDIDTSADLCCNKFYDPFHAKRFKQFQDQANDVMKNGKYIKWDTNLPIEKLRMKIQRTVAEVYHYWPQMMYDGYRNIWVVKPYEGSCGKGVCLMNDHCNILKHVIDEDCSSIVQKYIGNANFQQLRCCD